MSRTLGSTHRYRSGGINCTSNVCSSHPYQGDVRDLTNVNGGNIKVLGVKHVTLITGKITIHVNLLVVEDIKNDQSLASMPFTTVVFKFIFMRKAIARFNKVSARRFFTIISVNTMRQVWFFQIMFRVIVSVGQTLRS